MTFDVEEKGIIVAKIMMKPIPTASPVMTGNAVVIISSQISPVLNLVYVGFLRLKCRVVMASIVTTLNWDDKVPFLASFLNQKLGAVAAILNMLKSTTK